MMNIKELEAFSCLARQLHFAHAAKLLNMTPSTLSRLIQRLEDQVGTPLFVRDRRKVNLTAAGQAFAEYAQQSLVLWAELQKDVGSSAVPKGSVRIFCSVTASYSVLSDVLPDMRQQFPDVEINVFTGDQADAIPHVLEGRHDISVAARPQNLPDDLVFQSIRRSGLKLIAPKVACPVTTELASVIIEWERLPFIVAEHGVTRQRLEGWWQEMGIRPPVYAYVAGHEAVVSMVALGFGVALVPDIVVDHSPQSKHVQLLDMPVQIADLEIGFCARNSSLSSAAVKAVWGLAEQAANRGR